MARRLFRLAPFVCVLATLASRALAAPTPVIDPKTGLKWLPLSATAGMSFDQLARQLEPGGEFAGYEVATARQAATLLSDFLPPEGSPARDAASVASLMRSLGAGGTADGLGFTAGVVADPGPPMATAGATPEAAETPGRVGSSHGVVIFGAKSGAPAIETLPFAVPDDQPAGPRSPNAGRETAVQIATAGFFLVQAQPMVRPRNVPEPYALALVVMGVVAIGGARLVGKLD